MNLPIHKQQPLIFLWIILLSFALAGCEQETPAPESAIVTAKENSTPSVLVIHNGNILTMDAEFTAVDAVAIEGNQIIAVGSYKEVMSVAGEGAEQIDLEGRTVMPGFMDAHLHTFSTAMFELLEEVGLTRFKTIDEALELMNAIGQDANSGEWLMFNNIDFGTQSGSINKLTTLELDQVSRENPVFVLHAGGHIATVNSRALELMGVTRDTPDPEAGGTFGKTKAGELDGNLYGFAVLLAIEQLEPFNTFDRKQGTGLVSEQWSSQGLTTVGDAGVGAMNADELDLLLDLSESGMLKQRVRGYLSSGQEKYWKSQGIAPNHGNDLVRIVGYKVSADGSNQARTGLQREPYPGTDSKGLAYMDEQSLYENIVNKSNDGFQMAMHGNGDGAIDNIISAIKRARNDGVDVRRPRIEHCSIVQDDQLESLKELEISCSFLIGHVYLWGSAFRTSVFGQEKAEKLDRAGSFEKMAIPYSLHSDSAVTRFSPLEMVEIAVTRELFVEPGYILAPDERASREYALRAVTSTPAWQMMSEQQIGSLEVGKLADFVMLEENPLEVDANKIGEIKVLQTWIDGKKVY